MEIVVSVLIGAAAGNLALLLRKSSHASEWSILAVGILGALLGMAGSFWIGFLTVFGAPITSALGAAVALLLWISAQKSVVTSALPAERD